jgi:hypothetical protein
MDRILARGPASRDEWKEPDLGTEDGMEHFTIATVAEQSADFRRVLWTGKNSQCWSS